MSVFGFIKIISKVMPMVKLNLLVKFVFVLVINNTCHLGEESQVLWGNVARF